VYKQTLVPSEVIVVNDGSTDDTESLLRRLSDRLPKTFRWITKENGGSASARNAGIRLATRRFIAFLDHDDLWFPEKIARQMDQFAAEPELTLSFTAMTVAPYELAEDGSLRAQSSSDRDRNDATPADPSHAEISLIRKQTGPYGLFPSWNPEPEAVLAQLMSDPPMGSLSTVMVRREAFERIGLFNQELRISDDWLMWLNMAAAGMKFGHVPEEMVLYRNHESNLTRSRLTVWNDLCSMFDEFLATNELPRRVRKQIRLRRSCAYWHLITAIQELNVGSKRGARKHVLRAAWIHPPSVRIGWARMLGIGSAPRWGANAGERQPRADAALGEAAAGSGEKVPADPSP